MLGALSAASLTLGPGVAPATFTSQCSSNGGVAKALAFPSSNDRAQLLIKSSFSSNSRTTPSFRTAVAAVDSDPLSPEKQHVQKYYFVVANAKFMLDEEEHFKELLYERRRYYGEHDKEQDFWLVIEPKFLEKFPDITKRLHRPAVALVSTNGPWITFMKLRLDRVLSDSYEADSLEEALASNPTELEFEKPEKWVAPYPKYEFGWWEPFLPTGVKV
ncbi:Fragile histidine triad isoform 1 [Hibiscus syriacus]|uniref:Fragile histidine triad isoform 1 n=1 Tax=Hibiscus syriacus TaxID=106335 RepID=A0A6A3B6S2_HIBSY|nr:uncharacterized protein LOC120114575 [Hibiscus syriacus]KAE8712690.1 Fragile histidine triad isoform 1 [Hibiscus syriacus]